MTESKRAQNYLDRIHALPERERLSVYEKLLSKYHKNGLCELTVKEIVNYMEGKTYGKEQTN